MWQDPCVTSTRPRLTGVRGSRQGLGQLTGSKREDKENVKGNRTGWITLHRTRREGGFCRVDRGGEKIATCWPRRGGTLTERLSRRLATHVGCFSSKTCMMRARPTRGYFPVVRPWARGPRDQGELGSCTWLQHWGSIVLHHAADLACGQAISWEMYGQQPPPSGKVAQTSWDLLGGVENWVRRIANTMDALG